MSIILFSEFCGHQNEVPLLPTDTPTSNAVEYEIEPAPKTEDEDSEEKPDNETAGATKQKPADSGRRNHLVIFTVDISGSMNITTEVPALQGTVVHLWQVIFTGVNFNALGLA